MKTLQNPTFDDVFRVKFTYGFDMCTYNFKYPKRRKPIEVYSGDPVDHGNEKWWFMPVSPISSRRRSGVWCSIFVCFYVAISRAKISFQPYLWFFSMKIILRWKKLGVAIRKFRHFVTITVNVKTRLLFFNSFSSWCHKITTSQMVYHFLHWYCC